MELEPEVPWSAASRTAIHRRFNRESRELIPGDESDIKMSQSKKCNAGRMPALPVLKITTNLHE
jgi:hypothetical protein